MKIGQISFIRMTTPADVPYGSTPVGSKYQGQAGPGRQPLLGELQRPTGLSRERLGRRRRLPRHPGSHRRLGLGRLGAADVRARTRTPRRCSRARRRTGSARPARGPRAGAWRCRPPAPRPPRRPCALHAVVHHDVAEGAGGRDPGGAGGDQLLRPLVVDLLADRLLHPHAGPAGAAAHALGAVAAGLDDLDAADAADDPPGRQVDVVVAAEVAGVVVDDPLVELGPGQVELARSRPATRGTGCGGRPRSRRRAAGTRCAAC